jgi:plastocyanin
MNPGRALPLVAVLGLTTACARESAVNTRPNTGTDTASPVGGVQQVVIRAGLDLRFHPSTIVVGPGRVRLVLVNSAKAGAGPPHNVQFSGLPGADVPDVQAGYSASVTFTAPQPGTYDFVCSIHAQQGQTGTLVVRP